MLYIKGKPEVVTIDTAVPYKSSNKLMMADTSVDGGWWLPLLEKAYAKVNVNYEKLGLGWMAEAMRTLTNAPSQKYETSSLNSNTIWSIMSVADKRHFLLTAATNQSVYGLV